MRKFHWGLLGIAAALAAATLAGTRGCNPERVESGLFGVNRIYTGPRAEVWTARFGPGDSLIAAACVDSSLRLWRRDGALVADLRAPMGLTAGVWSPDGRYLAATAYDGAVYVWNWPEGHLLQRYPNHKGTAWTLRFNRAGTLLASAGDDGTIALRSFPAGALLRQWTAHDRTVWDIDFDPSGATLASGSFDSKLRFWNVADGRLLRTYDGHSGAVVAVAFSPDGKRLASTSDDKTVQLQEVASGRLLRTLATPEHQQGVSFSPDGERLLTSGRDKAMMGELLQNFFGDQTRNKGVSMRLWNLSDGKLLQTFSVHANDVNDVQFSSDGQWLLSAGADKKVVLWKQR